MGNLWDLLTHIQTFAGPSIMLIYPLYASVQAIESPSKLDDEQWLAYWILYSFITLLEMVAEPILYWIPIWYQVKLVVVAWLVLPQFRGASFVYEKYVREQLKKYGSDHKGGKASGNDHNSPFSSSSSPNGEKDNKTKMKFMDFLHHKKEEHDQD